MPASPISFFGPLRKLKPASVRSPLVYSQFSTSTPPTPALRRHSHKHPSMAEQITTATISTASAPPSPPPLIPSLPDDMSLQILARVPRFHYPFLSLVSKSWRSAVNSADLFHTRSLLRTSKSSLYLILRIDSSFHWYAEHNPQNSKRTFIPLPSMPHHAIGSSVVALGPKIYVIGGSVNDIPTNNVWIFDCRFNKWEMGPQMGVAREFSAAGELNGKIYVMGGCDVDNWVEVFDPKTVSWAVIPSEIGDKRMRISAMIESRFYAMADNGVVVYDAGCGEWGNVPSRLGLEWRGHVVVVVDNVLYCYDNWGKIRWYDAAEDVWKELRGVEEGLPRFYTFCCSSMMVDLDGKLCVVWVRKRIGKEAVDIMCAVIEVKRDVDGGLRGTIMSVEVVLVVPKGATISHCLAVEF